MPTPTAALATLRPDIGEAFEEFDLMANESGFIGYQVFRPFDAAEQAGIFPKMTVEQLLQTSSVGRNDRGGYNRINSNFTTDSYATREYGLEGAVDAREARIYRNYFDAELVAAKRVRNQVLTAAEVRIANTLFNTTTYTGSSLTTAITTDWRLSNAATNTPIADVEGAVNKVYTNTGMWPNAIIMTRTVFRNVRHSAQIVDRLKYQGFVDVTPGKVTTAALAQVFDVDYVIVAGGVKNTANETATASLSSIWNDDYVMVCRVATTNDMSEPCIGRTIHWSEDGSQLMGTVESYDEPQARGRVIRVRHDVDEKLLYTEMGHLLTGANS